jgi:hypothetical protein
MWTRIGRLERPAATGGEGAATPAPPPAPETEPSPMQLRPPELHR